MPPESKAIATPAALKERLRAAAISASELSQSKGTAEIGNSYDTREAYHSTRIVEPLYLNPRVAVEKLHAGFYTWSCATGDPPNVEDCDSEPAQAFIPHRPHGTQHTMFSHLISGQMTGKYRLRMVRVPGAWVLVPYNGCGLRQVFQQTAKAETGLWQDALCDRNCIIWPQTLSPSREDEPCRTSSALSHICRTLITNA